MSLAKVEVVMDGTRPVRTLVEDSDGVQHELPGVVDVQVELQAGDLPLVRVTMIAEIAVRKAYAEELGS